MEEALGERLGRQLRQILAVHEAEMLQRHSARRRHHKEAALFIAGTLHPWAETAASACHPLGLGVKMDLSHDGAELRLTLHDSRWTYAVNVHPDVDKVLLTVCVAMAPAPEAPAATLAATTPAPVSPPPGTASPAGPARGTAHESSSHALKAQLVENVILFPGPGVTPEELNTLFVAHFSNWLRSQLPS